MAAAGDDLDWASELEKDPPKASGRRARRGSGGAGSGSGGGGGRGGRGGRLLLVFLLGAAAGVAGAVFLPDLVGPWLPPGLGGPAEVVRGPVLDKRREDDRLLLTVETADGAVLASFRERVAEIDLLVRPGDTVALGVDRYRPFIEDPTVEGVRKARGGPAGDRPPSVPAGGEGAPADTAAGGTGTGETRVGEEPGAADTSGSASPAGPADSIPPDREG